jgi:predicted chitinase
MPSLAGAVSDAGGSGALLRRSATIVYANVNGNGDAASGDGYRFRGRGLIQLTGRNEYAAFARAIGKTAEQAAEFCDTTQGAAFSGCWYLASNGCLLLPTNGTSTRSRDGLTATPWRPPD